jgi:long-chain acyl-CoA synthetase
MEPRDHLERFADRPAVVMTGSGEIVTYADLDERSKRLAQLFRVRGLQAGDHVALLLENHPRYFEVFWAAIRAGLHITPINWHLKPDEASYIVKDCGAQALITSAMLAPLAAQLEPSLTNVHIRLSVDAAIPGFESYESAIAAHPAEHLDVEAEGAVMFYSSGTTGRPKGIKRKIVGEPFGTGGAALTGLVQHVYGFPSDARYLCPAPLYHAAPLGWSSSVQRLGGCIYVMERFDAENALAQMDRHQITHAQFVPTHFVRMLKLDEATRAKYDLSSLQKAIHAAAPCPVDVKQKMLAWWGPKIYEYYAGSEGNGFCAVGPEEWLQYPGTVGRALTAKVHICDEDGNELPSGEAGQIWFESDASFEYHNDPEKTAKTFNARGWSSLGDIGYLNDEGFLFLTDRMSHMIISGGVNIYPQEVENELTMHPAVVDVAVIGVPNEDLGEEVKAVVIPTDPANAGPALEAELIAFCRSRLSHFKCPVSVDFVTELPRLPTGKLFKRELIARYKTA